MPTVLRIVLAAVLALPVLGLMACSDGETDGASIRLRPVARVFVNAEGEIYLDDREVSLDELTKALADLRERDGEVWYHRENPDGVAPPQAKAAMKAVLDTKLPIRLAGKPDLSDSVGLADER